MSLGDKAGGVGAPFGRVIERVSYRPIHGIGNEHVVGGAGNCDVEESSAFGEVVSSCLRRQPGVFETRHDYGVTGKTLGGVNCQELH